MSARVTAVSTPGSDSLSPLAALGVPSAPTTSTPSLYTPKWRSTRRFRGAPGIAAESASAASALPRSAASVAVLRSAKLSPKGTRVRWPTGTAGPGRDGRAGPRQVSSRKPKPRTVWMGSPASLARSCPMKRSSDLDRPTTAVPHTSSIGSSADRLALPSGQGREDLKLGLGELLRYSLQRDLPAVAVDGDGTRDHRGSRPDGIAAGSADPPHDGLNTSQQHRLTDRLDQVVVAPARRPSTTAPALSRAVMMMTGTVDAHRSVRSTSRPSMSGRPRSNSTRSHPLTRLSASAPRPTRRSRR